MTRIVQCANFVTPTSGGLRTALVQLAEGYAAAGHEVVQVLPGPHDAVTQTPWGRVVSLRAPLVPSTGYRLLPRARQVSDVLESLEPDRLEVHDRTTLRGLGGWAATRGVPSLVVSHERLDRLLGQWLPPRLPLERMADRSNASLAACYDAVVCTTDWAAEEFRRLRVRNLVQVPLGVDLAHFHPLAADTALRRAYAADDEVLLLLASRLSREKRPELAIDTAVELLRRGHRLHLVVAGDGPMRAALEQRAAGLPVTFLGFVRDRDRMASLLATADLVLAPGPIETFGLAALESLASGTPVVANALSALREVLGPDSGAGEAVGGTPRCFADAVERVLHQPTRARSARCRAERFPWSATVAGFLAVHRLARPLLGMAAGVTPRQQAWAGWAGRAPTRARRATAPSPHARRPPGTAYG